MGWRVVKVFSYFSIHVETIFKTYCESYLQTQQDNTKCSTKKRCCKLDDIQLSTKSFPA